MKKIATKLPSLGKTFQVINIVLFRLSTQYATFNPVAFAPLLGILIPCCVVAQTPKTSIVEHFTNSNCGVCAATNPSIRTTMQPYLGTTLHLTFYPSSPYSNCFFSVQNPVENDARTNYYGLYGGTPQLAANGNSVTRQNLGAALATASTQTSNFSIAARQTRLTTDSVKVRVVVKKLAADATTSALIFAGVAEDTIAQTTGNSEMKHFDVFRKGLTSMVGNAITLPTTIGDSLVLLYKYKIGTAWNTQRLNAIVILQNTNKSVINAHKSPKIAAIVGTENIVFDEKQYLTPNPASLYLSWSENEYFDAIEIFDISGKIVLHEENPRGKIDVQHLENGFYIAKLKQNNQFFAQKIIISR